MRKEKLYLVYEESKVIPCTWGEKGHTLEIWTGKPYLAHGKRRSYLGDVDRKDIPCT
jgi:hypothetical protein